MLMLLKPEPLNSVRDDLNSGHYSRKIKNIFLPRMRRNILHLTKHYYQIIFSILVISQFLGFSSLKAQSKEISGIPNPREIIEKFKGNKMPRHFTQKR